jgi:hypothetical protein
MFFRQHKVIDFNAIEVHPLLQFRYQSTLAGTGQAIDRY